MNKTTNINCPHCIEAGEEIKLEFDGGFPGSYEEPSQPAALVCPECGLEDFNIPEEFFDHYDESYFDHIDDYEQGIDPYGCDTLEEKYL